MYFDSNYPGVKPWQASITIYFVSICFAGFVSGLIAKQWENIGVGGLFLGHVMFMGMQLASGESYLKSPLELLMLFVYLMPAVIAAAVGFWITILKTIFGGQ